MSVQSRSSAAQNSLIDYQNFITSRNPDALIVDGSSWPRQCPQGEIKRLCEKISGRIVSRLVQSVLLKNRWHDRIAKFFRLKSSKLGPTVICIPPDMRFCVEKADLSTEKMSLIIVYFNIIVQSKSSNYTANLSEKSFTIIFSRANSQKNHHEIMDLVNNDPSLVGAENARRLNERILPLLIMKCDALVIHPTTYHYGEACPSVSDIVPMALTRDDYIMKIEVDEARTRKI